MKKSHKMPSSAKYSDRPKYNYVYTVYLLVLFVSYVFIPIYLAVDDSI